MFSLRLLALNDAICGAGKSALSLSEPPLPSSNMKDSSRLLLRLIRSDWLRELTLPSKGFVDLCLNRASWPSSPPCRLVSFETLFIVGYLIFYSSRDAIERRLGCVRTELSSDTLCRLETAPVAVHFTASCCCVLVNSMSLADGIEVIASGGFG